MIQKKQLYISYGFLFCVIISPIIALSFLFDQDLFRNEIIEFICGGIFVITYLLFPIFFIYQIILKVKKRSKRKIFIISIITFLLFILSIVFYYYLYHIVDEAITRRYQSM